MNKLLSLAFGLTFVLVLSSAGCKQTPETPVETPAEIPSEAVKGKIVTTYADQGCSYLFVYQKDGKEEMLRPIELDAKYQKDGLRVAMVYRLSRVNNGGCDLANPCIIEWIEEVF